MVWFLVVCCNSDMVIVGLMWILVNGVVVILCSMVIMVFNVLLLGFGGGWYGWCCCGVGIWVLWVCMLIMVLVEFLVVGVKFVLCNVMRILDIGVGDIVIVGVRVCSVSLLVLGVVMIWVSSVGFLYCMNDVVMLI